MKDSAIVGPDTLREMGNKAFRENREHDAIQLYTEGIQCSQLGEADTRLYANRSLCHFRLSDFEKALEDADYCISRDASNWKAHYWRAKAKDKLVKTGKRPNSVEAAGLASASIARYLNHKVVEDMKINSLNSLLKFHLVSDPRDLKVLTDSSQPCTTILLRKGRYELGPFLQAKNIQIVGVENEVDIFSKYVIRIFTSNRDIILGRKITGKEIQVHFENITFIKGSGQVIADSGTTMIFYRCKFSNGQEACEDYPHCKGGKGCKNLDPNEFRSQFEQLNETKGSGLFCTSADGHAGVFAFEGGRIMLDSSILDGCGGGRALADGEGSVLKRQTVQ